MARKICIFVILLWSSAIVAQTRPPIEKPRGINVILGEEIAESDYYFLTDYFNLYEDKNAVFFHDNGTFSSMRIVRSCGYDGNLHNPLKGGYELIDDKHIRLWVTNQYDSYEEIHKDLGVYYIHRCLNDYIVLVKTSGNAEKDKERAQEIYKNEKKAANAASFTDRVWTTDKLLGKAAQEYPYLILTSATAVGEHYVIFNQEGKFFSGSKEHPNFSIQGSYKWVSKDYIRLSIDKQITAVYPNTIAYDEDAIRDIKPINKNLGTYYKYLVPDECYIFVKSTGNLKKDKREAEKIYQQWKTTPNF